jgi:excisionase family DNA binding protein
MPRPRTGPRRWYTITEAVKYSKFGRRTIYNRIADGTLPAYLPRGSRVYRIDGDDLDAMIMAEGRIPSAHLGDGREPAPARTGR